MNLKDTIEKKLKDAGVEYRFIPLPENIPLDIASHVAFHKIQMKDAVATLIYRTEKGFIAVQRRADTKTDEKKLREVAGIKELHFATNEELRSLGTQAGTVPLTGLDIPFISDKKVLDLPKAYCGAGINTLAVTLTPQDLVKLNNSTVGDFTYFEKSKTMLSSGTQRILSGITPSGDGMLHIGNYLGAVKQFAELSRTHECFLMVADLHALTTVQNREQLKKNTETLILNELALLMGDLGPELPNITFFRQSDVPMHAELQTILNNYTPLGLLKRAHAYKDKLAKDTEEDTINLGLFNYPMLMAADILIYKPDLVPVGKDQKQHIEITRDIAERFNKIYTVAKGVRPSSNSRSDPGGVFKLPEPYIPEEVAVVVGTDGKRKMSKSLGNIISIFETEEVIKKQVMSTYTDPTRVHATDPGHIEGNMVFAYLDFFGEKGKVGELKVQYTAGKVADVAVKGYLFETLKQVFGSARDRYDELKANPEHIKTILQQGAAKARSEATKTMVEVREAIGLTNKYSFFIYRHPEESRRSSGRREGPNRVTKFSGDSIDTLQNGNVSGTITINDFARVEQRVGKVVEAKNVEKSEKLIRLVVDFGDFGRRIIFTGVRPFGYTPEDLMGKQFLFVVNLEPRKMMNEESQGMILAVDPSTSSGQAAKPIFISAEGMPLGAKVR